MLLLFALRHFFYRSFSKSERTNKVLAQPDHNQRWDNYPQPSGDKVLVPRQMII
jgi:hypothetical protein